MTQTFDEAKFKEEMARQRETFKKMGESAYWKEFLTPDVQAEAHRRYEEKEYLKRQPLSQKRHDDIKRFYDVQLQYQSEYMRGITNTALMDEANELAEICRLPAPYPERKAEKPEVVEKEVVKVMKRFQDILTKRKHEIRGNEANVDAMKEFHVIHRKLNAIDEFLEVLSRKE